MSKRSKKQWPPEDANGVDSVFTVTVLAKNVGDKWMQCSQDDPADKQSFTAKVRITQDTPMEAVCTSVDCRAHRTQANCLVRLLRLNFMSSSTL